MAVENSRIIWIFMLMGTSSMGYSKFSNLISRSYRSYASLSNIQMVGGIKKDFKISKPVFKYAAQFGDKVALKDVYGSYTYTDVLTHSNKVATEITEILGKNLQERIAFLCPNTAAFVFIQWACWISGNIAVPLGHHQPLDLLEYYILDSGVNLIVTTEERASLMQKLADKTKTKLIVLKDFSRVDLTLNDADNVNQKTNKTHFESIGQPLEFYSKSDALVLYTSGSTGKPKGVVLSHKNLIAQVSSLVEMWNINMKDVILHTLPLNHIHGVINALLCPLSVGAKCIIHPVFNPKSVWGCLTGGVGNSEEQVNVFMGVPTMYVQLLKEYKSSFKKSERMIEYVKAVCSEKVRLMVSGSAPLPELVFDKWKHVTGHSILERYGMTEIGMALSNPLNGQRKPGFVGNPLPGVCVRIVHAEPSGNLSVVVEGDSKETVVLHRGNTSGHLQVKGKTVFSYYWGKPEETAKEFVDGVWFKTGDIAEFTNGSYRILGRSSVDIIKTGGYKISALQIESVILDLPDVEDVVVVGLPDMTWGQKVAAVVKLKENKTLELRFLQRWVMTKLPVYMIPTVLKVVDKIPRNALGKVNKKDVVSQLFHNYIS
uniref:AMP-dependent synthetase/ligase domain-containing protein n=1 Tax=Clastoptera arizonana TaxID=38151 RepID=A0A1B6DM65_9HEMI